MTQPEVVLDDGVLRIKATYCRSIVEWKVKNLLDLPCDEHWVVDSPVFECFSARWSLRIFPAGSKNKSLGLCLYNKASPSKVPLSLTVGIKRADESTFKLFEDSQKNVACNVLLKFIERSILVNSRNIFVPGNNLTITCTFHGDESIAGVEALSQDMKELIISGHKADITFKVKDKNLLAHELILSARSTVFRTMFEVDMVEKNSREIKIVDCEPDCFKDFLLFLYTGKRDIVKATNAVSLYMIADKYNIPSLKFECLDRMSHEISVESFCDTICLATIHKETDLLNTATAFFINNASSILGTQDWLTFKAEHPDMANELLTQLANKQTLDNN